MRFYEYTTVRFAETLDDADDSFMSHNCFCRRFFTRFAFSKRDVVQNAIDKYRLYDAEPLEVLRTVGSLDMAGMVGVYEGARRCGIPVILDGAVSIVASLAAERIYPGVKSVLIPSHKSREPLSALVCEALGINPVIDADMALGEGTGALLMLSGHGDYRA